MSEPLRIAITKGRLLDDSIRMFQKMGASCSELLDPGRRLVLDVPELGLSAVLAKAPDVVTYVENGVCDLGVVGKDTLLEQEPAVYELLDLRTGLCRMAVAAPEGFADDPSRTLRVASKFPRIAGEYYRSRGREIDVIKLNGSIEIAPLLRLSDVIVDIVETGTTLRENHLEVVETIVPISARLIANKAGFKFKTAQIERLLKDMRKEVEPS